MKLLDRYLLSELVGPFMFGVGVVLMLFEGSVIFQVLNTLDQRVSLWGLARVLLLLANFGKQGRPEPIIARSYRAFAKFVRSSG